MSLSHSRWPPSYARGTRAQSAPRLLDAGTPVEAGLRRGASHSYEVRLDANTFLRVAVEQHGIDAVMSLFAPDHTLLVKVDGPNGPYGREPLMFVAEAAGTYLLEVRASDEGIDAGRYDVRIEERRPATATDGSRVAAQAAFAQGL